MSKAILYASNTTSQPYVATGSIVNFGTIVRRYGNNLNMSGGNVVARGVGYYDVDTVFSFNGAAGTVTIQLYKDGVIIPGAEATITTVADTDYTVSIPCVIREVCCCESTITAIISGVVGTVSNAAIVVEKL